MGFSVIPCRMLWDKDVEIPARDGPLENAPILQEQEEGKVYQVNHFPNNKF